MFDSHCHLDDPRIDLDVAIQSLRAAGVSAAMIAGYGPERTEHAEAIRSHSLTDDTLRLYRAVGLHPWWLADNPGRSAEGFKALHAQARQPGVSALGEIGLDATRRKQLPAADQRRYFARGLAIANEVGLPVVLHLVGWHGHAQAELASCRPVCGGVVHRFGGPCEVIGPYLDAGLHLSLDVIAFRRDPAKVRRLAAEIPDHRLVLETDWPERGVTYEQSLAELARLYALLAADRGMSNEEFTALIDANNAALYRVSPPS